MEARCPSCSSIFAVQRTGAQYCPQCGSQVTVAETGETAPADPTPNNPEPGVPPPWGAAPPPAGGAGAPPPPPGSPELGGREPTHWERRAELGWFRGLWLTFKETLISPETFWRKLLPAERAQDALFYGWIIAVVAAIISGPLQVLQLAAQGPQFQEMLAQIPDLPPELRRIVTAALSPGGGLLLALVGVGFTAVIYPLRLIIGAAVLHLFCIIFGASKNGFWATFRVVAYSSGPLVLMGIPCIGFAAVIYMYVLRVWGLMRAQETSGVRATLAVIALPVVMCCIACGIGVVAFSALMSTLR